MPVRPTPVEFPLAGGIDTKTDEKLVQLPSFLDIQNAVFTKHGSLVKRTGYTALAKKDTTSTNLSGLKAISSRKNELVALGDKLYSYSDSTGTWYNQGNLPRFKLSTTDGINTIGNQTNVVSATDGSLRVIVWEESGSGLYYSICDCTSGAILQGATSIHASSTRPQVVWTGVGSNFLISYVRTDTASINILGVSGQNLSGTTTELQLTDLHSDYLYDMAWGQDGNDDDQIGWAVLVYKENTNNKLRAVFLNTSGAIHSGQAPVASTGASAAVTNYISVDATPGAHEYGVVVTFSTASTTETVYISKTGGFASTNAVANVSSVAGTCVITDDLSAGQDIHHFIDTGTDVVRHIDVNTTGTTFAAGMSLAGKVTRTNELTSDDDDAEYVVPVFYSSTLQSVVLLLDRNITQVAALSPGLASARTAGYPLPAPQFRQNLTPLGQIGSIASGSPSVVTLTTSTDIANFDIGDDIIANPRADGDGSRIWHGNTGNRKVAGVASAGTVTFVGNVSASYQAGHYLFKLGQTGNSEVSFAVSEKTRLAVGEAQDDQYTQAGIQIYTLDTSKNAAIDSAEYSGSLYVGGSTVWQYDGDAVVEAGFQFYPEVSLAAAQVISVTDGDTISAVNNLPYTWTSSGGGGNTLVYYVVYEWYDAQGRRIQSAAIPFTFLDVEDPGTDNLKFTIPKYPFTHKTNVRGAVYRTHNDSTAIAYRVSGTDGHDVSSDYAFVDSTAESALKSGEIYYGSSGELGNVAPLPSTILLAHDDRIFYVPARHPNRVYFSKRPSSDYDLPGFNEGLYFQVPRDGGDITALGVLDGKLVVFKRDRIFMVTGDGPNNLGVGSYGLPRVVSTDTGCKDGRSVVRVPQGIMFQSDKGIYWLNRGEAVNYIGAPAESYNAQTIQAANLIPDERMVYFLTNGERTLGYNYERNAWTTFTQHAGLSATLISDTYYYLRADGVTVYKGSSSYTDNGTAIVVLIETPWIRPSGSQQLWHIRRASVLGNYSSTHDIKAKVHFNYDPDYLSYEQTWNPEGALNVGTLGGNATLGGGAALGINDATQPDRVYQFGHLLKYQRVQAVKFTFTEVPPANSPGASFELTTLALSAAGYQDLFHLPGSKEI